MADNKINISVEATIHKAMRELAIDVQKQFGITIDNINIDWLDVIGADRVLHKIELRTSSK